MSLGTRGGADNPAVEAFALPASDRLPEALLEAVGRAGTLRSFPARAILLNEGDVTDSLYLVTSGRVRIYASSSDGREVVLSELGPGEFFGELSLDGAPRSASVQASEPCSCRVIQGHDLRRVMGEHPDFALHLTAKLIRMVRRLTEQVRGLALQDVYGRLVRLLIEQSEPGEGGERVVRHKMTQKEIADRVGSSREMINRVLKELVEGGYVATRDDGRLVVKRKLPAAR